MSDVKQPEGQGLAESTVLPPNKTLQAFKKVSGTKAQFKKATGDDKGKASEKKVFAS
jgi:hypothetical protein